MLGSAAHALALGGAAVLLAGAAPAVAEPAVFTAEDMLSTPRPAVAIAAPGGKHALSVVNQWDPKADATTSTVWLLDTDPKGSPRELFSAPNGEIADPIWLSNRTVAYVNGTALFHFGIGEGDSGDRIHLLDFPEGTEPSALKYEPTTGTLAFSAKVWLPDGDLSKVAEHDKAWEDRGYTGTVFNDLFVRHWDTWRVPDRIYTLAATKIHKKGDQEEFTPNREFINLLKDTGLYSQMDAIDPSWFSLSSTYAAIALKPNTLNVAIHTRMDLHLVSLDGTGEKPIEVTQGKHGALSAINFSPDGKNLAWLQMATDGYESDKRVVVVHTLADGGDGSTKRWTDSWDRSPTDISWDHDSKSLYLLSEYNGRILPYHISTPGHLPTPLLFKESTQSITLLDGAKSTFLLTINSIQHPNEVYVLDLEDVDKLTGDPHKQPAEALHQISDFSSAHIAGRLDTLAPEELWFKGDEGRRVMAWTIKPRGWAKDDAKAKWPMAFLIHGGPQSAWEDSWSTRWNPAVWASMGYFVIAVNPTGSTGYGQEFIDRINQHWGDRPFHDLVAGYQAALAKFPEIDPERTGAAGASYGGYMTNWINGHNVFGFKCLVHHDGILDLPGMYHSTEEVWFPNWDFGGSVLDNREQYEKWNPLNHVKKWNTPTLVIQGGRDFRLPESQGIGTFTALQLRRVKSSFLYFPDENHWVLKPKNSRKWHEEVFKWMDTFVGAGTNRPNSSNNVTDPIG